MNIVESVNKGFNQNRNWKCVLGLVWYLDLLVREMFGLESLFQHIVLGFGLVNVAQCEIDIVIFCMNYVATENLCDY